MKLTESDVKTIIRQNCKELGQMAAPELSLNTRDFIGIREKAERLVELADQLELWQLRRGYEGWVSSE